MTVIAVLAIVTGLLYAYSDQGWKLFYQSYGRGLSQVKAKLAIRIISDELREANKARVFAGSSTSYGVPLPDDAVQSSPFLYFTKPITFEKTGETTGYDYILYYFAKPKEKIDFSARSVNRSRRSSEKTEYYVLKTVRFINQSKFFTEDQDKTWPFQPPLLELGKSRLSEDDEFIESLKNSGMGAVPDTSPEAVISNNNDLLLDHFSVLKKDKREIPVSGSFTANSLTDPFSNKNAKITFLDDYKNDKPVTIKIFLEESPFLVGLMGAKVEFETSITPRN